MEPSEVFSFCNMLVMPMWLLMIIAPKWRPTKFLIDYKVIPIILSIVYSIYIGISISSGGGMDFGSLESVKALFTVDNAVLAGWVHYLAFDLLVGMWMIHLNEKIGLHQLVMAPLLLGTFMMGPVGFLLFWIITSLKKSS